MVGGKFFPLPIQTYPGYQRFFLACDGELCFVGHRPTPVWPRTRAAKPLTVHEKPLAPRVIQTLSFVKVENTFEGSLSKKKRVSSLLSA